MLSLFSSKKNEEMANIDLKSVSSNKIIIFNVRPELSVRPVHAFKAVLLKDSHYGDSH